MVFLLNYIKSVKLLKKEINNIKVICFFLLLYISIKLTPFKNNVNDIFLKRSFEFDKENRNSWSKYRKTSYAIK